MGLWDYVAAYQPVAYIYLKKNGQLLFITLPTYRRYGVFMGYMYIYVCVCMYVCVILSVSFHSSLQLFPMKHFQ